MEPWRRTQKRDAMTMNITCGEDVAEDNERVTGMPRGQ